MEFYAWYKRGSGWGGGHNRDQHAVHVCFGGAVVEATVTGAHRHSGVHQMTLHAHHEGAM